MSRDVSVVIPVRDGASVVGDQLAALARQTFTGSWDVVVVDNGSTDGTRDVVESYRSLLPALRVVDAAERQGPAHARNVGARVASGEWIAFCDADDVVHPDWLVELWALRGSGAVVAGALDMYSLNPPGTTEAPPPGGHEGWRSMSMEFITEQLPTGTWGFLPFAYSGNVMIRKDVFDGLGGFDEHLRYCEDVDLCWRAQLKGLALVAAPKAVVQIRLRATRRQLLQQCVNYGRWDAEIYRRYREFGASRRGVGALAGRLWWLTVRFPYLVLGERRRRRWIKILGEVVGRLRGAIDVRTWYF